MQSPPGRWSPGDFTEGKRARTWTGGWAAADLGCLFVGGRGRSVASFLSRSPQSGCSRELLHCVHLSVLQVICLLAPCQSTQLPQGLCTWGSPARHPPLLLICMVHSLPFQVLAQELRPARGLQSSDSSLGGGSGRLAQPFSPHTAAWRPSLSQSRDSALPHLEAPTASQRLR